MKTSVGRRYYAALVVLPRDRTQTDALACTPRVSNIVDSMLNQPASEGTLWLPRFEAESSLELKQTLRNLGLRRAFEDDAEFPHVADQPLEIDQVIQKVKVEVDEEGTVAAAATAVCMAFGAAPTMPARWAMRCDRPFGFVVISLRDKAIMQHRHVCDVGQPFEFGSALFVRAPRGTGSTAAHALAADLSPSLGGRAACRLPRSPSVAERCR